VADFDKTDEGRRLLDAILTDDVDEFERAIDDGANVNAVVAKFEKGWSMCAATQPGKEHFLRALLYHGAEPDLVNPHDSAVGLPTVCSMVNGNLAAFDILIEAGADPHLFGSGQTSLYVTALQLGNFDIGLRFLEIIQPSHEDMVYTKEMIEGPGTLQSPRTEALAAHIEARGIPVQLPPRR